MSTFFVSYRRDDEPFAVDTLVHALQAAYGPESVFQDIHSIEAGEPFPDRLTVAIAQASVVLIAIGPDWNAGGRLANDGDFVRSELTEASRLDKPIVPVLLGATAMPRIEQLPPDLSWLPTRNAVHLRSGRDAENDLRHIVERISKLLPIRLRIEYEGPGFILGDLSISVDGNEVAQGSLRRGVTTDPVPLLPGAHTITARTALGGIERASERVIELKSPGDHVAVVRYDRVRADFDILLR